jgi:hypothetical protein
MVATGSHILDNGMTKTEKLFARLTRKNAAFAKHVYRFDCSNSEKHLGHTVSKEWAKTNRYFSLLKDGYEAFISASNTKG